MTDTLSSGSHEENQPAMENRAGEDGGVVHHPLGSPGSENPTSEERNVATEQTRDHPVPVRDANLPKEASSDSPKPMNRNDDDGVLKRPVMPLPSQNVVLGGRSGERAPVDSNSQVAFKLMRPFPDERMDVHPYQLDEGVFEEALERLESERVLFMTCAHADILVGLYYRFADHFADHEKWEYIVRSSDQRYRGSGVVFEQIVDWMEEQNGPTVGFIEIAESSMFDSLYKRLRRSDVSHFFNLMRSQGKYLICRLDSEVFDMQPKNGIWDVEYFDGRPHTTSRGYCFWKVPFELALLSRYAVGNDSQSPSELNERIQVNRNCWPKDEHEYYDELMKFIPKGLDVVSQILDETTAKPHDFDTIFEGIHEGNSVQKAVYFTAAFFPKLPMNDFDQLVSVLVEGEEVVLRRRVKVPPPAAALESSVGSATPQDSIAANPTWTRQKKTVSGTEYWKQHADRVMGECQLKTHGLEGEKCYVDFRLSGCSFLAREHVRTTISENLSHFKLRQFEKIYASGIYFSPPPITTRELSDKLAVFASELVSSFPDNFGASWLEGIVRGIQHWNPQIYVSDRELAEIPHDVLLLAKYAEAAAEKAQNTVFFYNRLGELCRQLQIRPECRSVLNEFLSRILVEPSNASDVLHIVKRLRPTAEFDYYDWLRKVMKTARFPVRIQILQDLLDDADSSSDQFVETMRNLRTWLPSATQLVRPASADEKYALAFIWFFLARIYERAIQSPEKRIIHPVVPSDRFSDEEASEWCRSIKEWVLHPLLSTAVAFVLKDEIRLGRTENSIDDESAHVDADPSALIGEILEGLWELADHQDRINKSQGHSIVEQCHSLTSEILRTIHLNQRYAIESQPKIRQLKNHLVWKSSFHLEQLSPNSGRKISKQERVAIKARRARVKSLRKVIQELTYQR